MKSIDFAHKLRTLFKRGHIELTLCAVSEISEGEEVDVSWLQEEDKPEAMIAKVKSSIVVFVGNGGRVLFLDPGDEIHVNATGSGYPTNFFVVRPGQAKERFGTEDHYSFGMFASVHPRALKNGR